MCDITVEDVKEIQPTDLPDSVIELMISTVEQACACFDAKNVPEDVQKLLCLYGVAHQIVMADDGGEVKSQRGQSGASRTLAIEDSNGITATRWGKLVKQLDEYGCLTPILDNSGGWLFAAAIGPSNYE